MSNVAEKTIVLCLDKDWHPIEFKNVRDAITSLIRAQNNEHPQNLALKIDYEMNENNYPIFENVENITALTWEEWIELPPKHWDTESVICSARRSFRIPTVVIAHNFSRKHVPREFSDRPSKSQIMRRDNFTCQITNKQLPREKLNVDHIIPKSKGGKDTWDNLICCSKELNTKKGSKSLEEMGLKLVRKPFKPKPSDNEFAIKEVRHVDHYPFLVDKIKK